MINPGRRGCVVHPDGGAGLIDTSRHHMPPNVTMVCGRGLKYELRCVCGTELQQDKSPYIIHSQKFDIYATLFILRHRPAGRVAASRSTPAGSSGRELASIDIPVQYAITTSLLDL